MNKLHMTAVAAIVAGAVTVGGVAISNSGGSTPAAGATTRTDTSKTVADRTASLDALEASLDRQLADATSGSVASQPTGPPAQTVSVAGHDDGDDHGGWEHDDDHGSDDD